MWYSPSYKAIQHHSCLPLLHKPATRTVTVTVTISTGCTSVFPCTLHEDLQKIHEYTPSPCSTTLPSLHPNRVIKLLCRQAKAHTAHPSALQGAIPHALHCSTTQHSMPHPSTAWDRTGSLRPSVASLQRRQGSTALGALCLHLHPTREALWVEKVTAWCDKPLTHWQQPHSCHADDTLNDAIACEGIISLHHIVQQVIRAAVHSRASAAAVVIAAIGRAAARRSPAAADGSTAAVALAAMLAAEAAAELHRGTRRQRYHQLLLLLDNLQAVMLTGGLQLGTAAGRPCHAATPEVPLVRCLQCWMAGVMLGVLL